MVDFRSGSAESSCIDTLMQSIGSDTIGRMWRLDRRRLLAGASVALSGVLVGPTPAGSAVPARERQVIVRPGDRRYQELVVGNNQRWTASPAYVVVPTSTAQVVDAVQEAVRSGRRISVRSGGHCYEDFVSHPAAQVIIDLSELDEVTFDTGRRAFAVGPGARLLSVYQTLFRRWGVTIPAGTCYSVGAGGHIVGGGYGLLSRQHGLTVDHLDAVEVVVVDQAGRARAVVATSAAEDPNADLWWAHTGGGGGNFGIITRYWLRSPGSHGADPSRLLPRPPATVLLSGLALSWAELDLDRFSRLVRNFGRWHEANSSPDSSAVALSSILALSHRAAGAVGLVTQVDGDAPNARELLDGFLADVLDGVGATAGPVTAPVSEFGAMPALADPQRWPWLHAAAFLGTNTPALTSPILRADHKAAYHRHAISDPQVATIFQHLTREDVANPNAGAVLFSFGGRVNAVPPTATAVAQRDSILKVLYQSFWSDPAADEVNVGWVRDIYGEVYAATGGVPVPDDATDGCYINYPDTDLNDSRWNRSGVPWHTLYYKQNYPRLQLVKARWDPRDVFRHRQSIRLPS